jgi:hypothetical protein
LLTTSVTSSASTESTWSGRKSSKWRRTKREATFEHLTCDLGTIIIIFRALLCYGYFFQIVLCCVKFGFLNGHNLWPGCRISLKIFQRVEHRWR